jgi:hypothetical protein
VCGKILGPVYDHEKEHWRMLTKNKFMKLLKKNTIAEIVKLNR